MPLVFISPYKKSYIADTFSLANFLSFIILAFSIIIPFFAAYATEDFWQRLQEYNGHPIVEYYNTYMLYVTRFTENSAKTFFDSSERELNDKFISICNDSTNENICLFPNTSILTETSIDSDRDSLSDKLTFKYVFGIIDDDAQKMDIKIILFLKYGLKKNVKLLMTPMIYINIPIIIENKSHKIRLKGDLKLIQKSPIPASSKTNKLYYFEKPLEIENNDHSPFDLQYYYNKYKNLNYTLKYDYEEVDSSSGSSIYNNNTEVEIEMNIPNLQNILYYQSVFDTLKYAWMQYFYIFLPIYLILYILLSFVLRNNIFTTTVKSDIK